MMELSSTVYLLPVALLGPKHTQVRIDLLNL